MLFNKHSEHERAVMDVVCTLADYSFTKYNCGMPRRSK